MKKKYLYLTTIAATIYSSISIAMAVTPQPIDYQQYQSIVKPIVDSMTLDQKLGQMTLPKFTMLMQGDKINFNLIQQYALGALLAAGGEDPNGVGGVTNGGGLEPKDYMKATKANWLAITNEVKANPIVVYTADGQVSIGLLLGVDAVHGDYNLLGSVMFPQNIALSMTHNADLLEKDAEITTADVKSIGFNWVYAPTVAINHNPDWGRTYETLGSQPELTQLYTEALVQGFQQNNDGKITGVLATVKHFLGDGATWDGADEGNDKVFNFDNFLQVNKAGYVGAIDAGAGSIMVSYSAINNLPMTFNKYLLTDELRGDGIADQPYQGLLVTDYGAIDKAASQGLPATTQHWPYPTALALALNSGMDLVMLSNAAKGYKTVPQYLSILKNDVATGQIPISRINDAVTHILEVKYAMGLIQFNNVPNFVNPAQSFSQQEKIATAVKTAEQSLVLLKNQNNLLPLANNKIKYIVLVGESIINQQLDNDQYQPTLYANYNNIGAQNGGWTLAWQGIDGNALWKGKNKQTSGAVSILAGLQTADPNAEIIYPHYTSTTDMNSIHQTRAEFLNELRDNYPQMNASNTVIIGTLAEPPYAEFMGDINSPYCTNSIDADHGCLYNFHLNPYLPLQQKKTLAMHYRSFAKKVINIVKQKDLNIPLISVLLSGRSMIVNKPLKQSDSFIAAWLPGTTGGTAIANAIFGNYLFCNGTQQGNNQLCAVGSPNTLTVNWVRDMQQLKNYPIYANNESGFVGFSNPLFSIGYGLSTHK